MGEQADEVGPVLPVDRFLTGQAQEGLVDDRGGFQGVARALAPEEAPGQGLQLVVDECDGLVGRRTVPLVPPPEQAGEGLAQLLVFSSLDAVSQRRSSFSSTVPVAITFWTPVQTSPNFSSTLFLAT